MTPPTEWNEAKRLRVLRERGIDFLRAAELFDGRPVYSYPSPRGVEVRWVSVGVVLGRCIAVVWTRRGDAVRIVTARRARDGEERRYREILA
jgi:uncharacterized protein